MCSRMKPLQSSELSVRSDVIHTWGVDEATCSGGYYYQVKVTVHGCGFKDTLSKKKTTYNGVRNHIAFKQTRILLIP